MGGTCGLQKRIDFQVLLPSELFAVFVRARLVVLILRNDRIRQRNIPSTALVHNPDNAIGELNCEVTKVIAFFIDWIPFAKSLQRFR